MTNHPATMQLLIQTANEDEAEAARLMRRAASARLCATAMRLVDVDTSRVTWSGDGCASHVRACFVGDPAAPLGKLIRDGRVWWFRRAGLRWDALGAGPFGDLRSAAKWLTANAADVVAEIIASADALEASELGEA